MQFSSDAALSELAQSIQLAITPVFLLSGVAVFLNLLNTRLTRVIDRVRVLENREDAPEDTDAAELEVLARRRRWINRAITLCTLCALLVSCSLRLYPFRLGRSPVRIWRARFLTVIPG